MTKGKVILSWSGDKDSVTCLDRLLGGGYEVVSLVTTASKDLGKTYGHDEKLDLIEAQARNFGIPVHFITTTWEDYSWDFVKELNKLKEKYNAEYVAFGDLYIEGHKEWSERASQETGLQTLYPNWMKEEEAEQAYFDFLQTGYKAKIIRVSNKINGIDQFLGKDLDTEFGEFLLQTTSCLMGEHGEYHTFVYDGPLFQEAIPLQVGGIVETENSKRIEIDCL